MYTVVYQKIVIVPMYTVVYQKIVIVPMYTVVYQKNILRQNQQKSIRTSIILSIFLA